MNDELGLRARNLFGTQPVSEEWASEAGFAQPDRLLLMTLQKGKGDAFDVVFGKGSWVHRDIGGLSADELKRLILKGLPSASTDANNKIRHNARYMNRARTTLSLATQGSFYLALFLTGKLKEKATFAKLPFGAQADGHHLGPEYTLDKLPIKYFWWSNTLDGGRIAVMAAHNPIGNKVVIPYNINIVVKGGQGSGDVGEDQYDGVACETPIIIDPDMRWPDGTEPPNLPPPPG